MGQRLDRAFYERETREVARELIGKRLVVHEPGGPACAGVIVETEAYLGTGDPASHAARGSTPRSQTMFGPPGVAYVYFIYGMHYCLNAVTEPPGTAGAVLIRALEAQDGIERMQSRRGDVTARNLANGPGKLCAALGIDRRMDGASLLVPPMWVEDTAERPEVAVTTRIGLSVGCEHPWRYLWAGHPCVSRGRPS